MTASRDPDRLIAAYLENGPTELASDSYLAVDETVQRTRQRTVIGPWRTRPMNLVPRALVAAAAVIVAAVVGLTLFPRAPSVGPGAVATATPSPSTSAAASGDSASGSTEPSSGPPVYRWPGSLAAGTYTTSFVWDASLRFTFTVPAGWQALDINVAKNNRISLVFFPITDVADPSCLVSASSQPELWTADAVLTALGKLVTFDRAAVDARVGDRDARYVTFTARPPIGCQTANNLLFRTPTPACVPDVCGSVGPATFGLEFGNVAHHERLWLMNVGRQVVAMNAVWTDEATPAETGELQSLIDSVRLETPLATPAPQAESLSPGG